MLGKDHLEISLMFSVPFILYLILYILDFGLPIYIAVVFPMCVAIGSLTPDADCKGKSTLYYKHQLVYLLMKPIHRFIFLLTERFLTQYPDRFDMVKEEHRGMLHSLVGVFLSSFILTVIFSIFSLILLYFLELFSFSDLFYIFIFQRIHVPNQVLNGFFQFQKN
jgi:Predicted membrane-bound metal-dependent hydrolase (DUF457).